MTIFGKLLKQCYSPISDGVAPPISDGVAPVSESKGELRDEVKLIQFSTPGFKIEDGEVTIDLSFDKIPNDKDGYPSLFLDYIKPDCKDEYLSNFKDGVAYEVNIGTDNKLVRELVQAIAERYATNIDHNVGGIGGRWDKGTITAWYIGNQEGKDFSEYKDEAALFFEPKDMTDNLLTILVTKDSKVKFNKKIKNSVTGLYPNDPLEWSNLLDTLIPGFYDKFQHRLGRKYPVKIK